MQDKSREKDWIDYTRHLFDGRAQELWFRWIGWVFVAAALIAIGRRTESFMLEGVGYVSSLLAFIYILKKIEDFADFLSARTKGPWFLSFLLFASVQVSLSFATANALDTIIESTDDLESSSASSCMGESQEAYRI